MKIMVKTVLLVSVLFICSSAFSQITSQEHYQNSALRAGLSSNRIISAGSGWRIGRAHALIYSDSTLSGPWIGINPLAASNDLGAFYMIFDGQGGIGELGWFSHNFPDSLGTYSVQPDGSFSGFIWMDDYVPFAGQFDSDTSAVMTVMGLSLPLLKVTNLKACSGKWTGSFVQDTTGDTRSVEMHIDESGQVDSCMGFVAPVTGRFFDVPDHVAGQFCTGEPSGESEKWQQVVVREATLLVGQRDTMRGAFALDCACPSGTFSMVRDTMPTAVLITSFEARALRSGVELSWEIFADEKVKGFRIYRGQSDAPGEMILNQNALIPPETRSYIDENVQATVEYYYILAAVKPDNSATRSPAVTVRTRAFSLELGQNYPNPFNPSTEIGYYLPERCRVHLDVYDARGNLVIRLIDAYQDKGKHSAVWNGRDAIGSRVSSGVYLCRLRAGKTELSRKMVLLK